MKRAGLGTLLLVSVLAVIAMIWAITFAAGWLTAGPSGKLQARQDILSGQSRIVAYNHFFDACAGIQGLEGQLQAQQGALKTSSSPEEQDRIRANIAGLQGAHAEAVAQYNADAAKSYTIGQFRSIKLPYHLDSHPEGGTVCTV